MPANRKGLLSLVFLALAAALAVAPFFIKPDAAFKGSDDLAGQAITELRPGYTPWFHSLWAPPSSEVASLLFALQAALGAGFIGYYLGSRNRKEKPGNDHS